MDDDEEPEIDWLKVIGLLGAITFGIICWALIFWAWNAFGVEIGIL